MRLLPSKQFFMFTGWTLTAMFLGMGYNSCSDVHFSQSKTNGSENTQCVDGSCPEPTPYTDVFTVPRYSAKADILLVLDNSGSMNEDLRKLGEKLDGLVQILDAGGIDWQMCYITTDVGQGGRAQLWRTLSGNNVVNTNIKVLTPATPDKLNMFSATTGNIQGGQSGNEQGIRTIGMAINDPDSADCFRADAALATVIISDEDEKSCGGRCANGPDKRPSARGDASYAAQYNPLELSDDPQTLIASVRAKWSEKPFTGHAIVIREGDNACYDVQDVTNPAFFGVEYSKLQKATGGILGDICAASYATQLQDIGRRTQASLSSVTLRCAPYAGQVQVAVNPTTAATWQLQGNKILFSMPLPEGTMVTVNYKCL